jgi:hypothetical protein
MKVAQHFSAGLAFFNPSAPVGTMELRCREPKNGPTSYLSFVPTATNCLFPIDPAINCWATFFYIPPSSALRAMADRPGPANPGFSVTCP